MLNMLRIVPAWSWKKLRERNRIDARHGDERADAIDDQAADQEDRIVRLSSVSRIASPRLRPGCLSWFATRVSCALRAVRRRPQAAVSTLPPAASIAARAPFVILMPLT